MRLYKDEMRCKKVTYILTNYHVIDGVEDLKVSFADGSSYDAVLVGGEADNDIAVLKIEADGLLPVTVGNSRNMQVGEQVVAIGNPLGELTFTLTAGYISALDREMFCRQMPPSIPAIPVAHCSTSMESASASSTPNTPTTVLRTHPSRGSGSPSPSTMWWIWSQTLWLTAM